MTDPVNKHRTTHIGQAAGYPAAFLMVILYAVLWLVFSPATFEWNAVATHAVFMMTLFIQRANRRDNLRFTPSWMNFCAWTTTQDQSLRNSTSRNPKRLNFNVVKKCERTSIAQVQCVSKRHW
jgi:hypothetical protein